MTVSPFMTTGNRAPAGGAANDAGFGGAPMVPGERVGARNGEGGNKPGRRTVPVISQRVLDDRQGVYELVVRDAYTAKHAQPAQFVNLYPSNAMTLLPRPFGVAYVSGDDVALIYQIVGEGTREFSTLSAGDTVDVLGPLGNPFNVDASANYVLVGGGLGVPPLLYAAQKLSARNDVRVTTAFGYRDMHFADGLTQRFVPVGRMHAISNDEGNVIDLLEHMESELDVTDGDGNVLRPVILSCGPTPMMRAVAQWASARGIPSQLSLEARMGCGFGACVACVVETAQGRRKVCTDGPVFSPEELGWTA